MYMFLLLFCCILQVNGGNELIVLTDATFEHLTQAATGATTGDWLVLMAPDTKACAKCEAIERELIKVKNQVEHVMNVAKLESSSSRLTLRRFNIKEPVIMLFRSGNQWVYGSRNVAADIMLFIERGYLSAGHMQVVKPLDRFDVWQEDFTSEIKAAMKERRLPDTHSLLVLCAMVSLMATILLCACAPKKHEKQK